MQQGPPVLDPMPSGAAHLPVLGDDLAEGFQAVLGSLIERSITGFGPLKGAMDVAEEHLMSTSTVDVAVDRLVRTHVRLAGATGFITGLGGMLTVPFAVPAGVGGLYLIGARMAAGIAHLRGYDVHSEEVRSAIAVCLIGSAAAGGAKRAGVHATTRFLTASIRRIPARPLLAINRAVGFRFITKAGTKGVLNLTRAAPLVGGPISSAVDIAVCRAIGSYACKVFSAVPGDRRACEPVVDVLFHGGGEGPANEGPE